MSLFCFLVQVDEDDHGTEGGPRFFFVFFLVCEYLVGFRDRFLVRATDS